MNILIFGASIVQGFFDEECGGWVNRLTGFANKRCMESDHEIYVAIFNLGISGNCTNRLLERFDSESGTRLRGDKKDSAILFAIGINDTQRYVKTNELKTTEKQFLKNINTLYTQAKARADTVIFLGLLPIIEGMVQPMPWATDRSHFTKDIIAYDQMIQDLSLDKGCGFIPMQDVFGDSVGKYLTDGIHPNTEGHRLIFERVKEYLEKENII